MHDSEESYFSGKAHIPEELAFLVWPLSIINLHVLEKICWHFLCGKYISVLGLFAQSLFTPGNFAAGVFSHKN